MPSKREEWFEIYRRDNPQMHPDVCAYVFDNLYEAYMADPDGFNKMVRQQKDRDRKRMKIQRNLEDAGHKVDPKLPPAIYEGVEVFDAPPIEPIKPIIEEEEDKVEEVKLDPKFTPFPDGDLGIMSI